MNVLVFKTDIKSRKKVRLVQPVFRDHPSIVDWSVDTEDKDNVLRVVALDKLSEESIIRMVKGCGFHSEVLTD